MFCSLVEGRGRGRGSGASHFPAMVIRAAGLERPPGSIVASPARRLAWPKTAPHTRQDCQTFLKNIPAIYGMWLVTLLLLYSLQEGKKHCFYLLYFSIKSSECLTYSTLIKIRTAICTNNCKETTDVAGKKN